MSNLRAERKGIFHYPLGTRLRFEATCYTVEDQWSKEDHAGYPRYFYTLRDGEGDHRIEPAFVVNMEAFREESS